MHDIERLTLALVVAAAPLGGTTRGGQYMASRSWSVLRIGGRAKLQVLPGLPACIKSPACTTTSGMLRFSRRIAAAAEWGETRMASGVSPTSSAA
jgi:hypothetical protein